MTPADPKSPYDPEDPDEEDLWFLPAPLDESDAETPPWPQADQSDPLSPKAWRAAEACHGRELAEAAASFARLDERLSHVSAAHPRLALMAASAAFEAESIWIATERLALYLALREGTREQAQDLSRADWAHRRLLSGLDPIDDIAAYLGRHPTDHDGLAGLTEQAMGASFRAEAEAWIDQVAALHDTHPFTQAAAGFHLWRLSGLSPIGNVVEAAVVTSGLGAAGSRACNFVPATLGSRRELMLQGSAEMRLNGWLRATTHGCQRLLMELDKILAWRKRAIAQTTDLSGRTVPRLIETLVGSQLVSAELLAAAADVSRPAALRNLVLFEARGLVREVTGQSRYRFWTLV